MRLLWEEMVFEGGRRWMSLQDEVPRPRSVAVASRDEVSATSSNPAKSPMMSESSSWSGTKATCFVLTPFVSMRLRNARPCISVALRISSTSFMSSRQAAVCGTRRAGGSNAMDWWRVGLRRHFNTGIRLPLWRDGLFGVLLLVAGSSAEAVEGRVTL